MHDRSGRLGVSQRDVRNPAENVYPHSMKTIGLLGGMSWESTREYYRLINESVRRCLGGLHSAEILLASVDFAPLSAAMNRGAEAVILGCTELPLIIAPDESPLPLIDTTRIHAAAAVDFAL